MRYAYFGKILVKRKLNDKLTSSMNLSRSPRGSSHLVYSALKQFVFIFYICIFKWE